MRKLITVFILAAVVFAGCSKVAHTDTRKPAAEGEPSMTEAKSSMDVEFEDKIKAIDDMGKQVIDDIRTEASKAVSEIKAAIPTTTTATTAPEPKEIALNVETQRGDGTLTFIKVETNPQKNEIIFYYETSDEKAVMPNSRETFLQDKNGAKYISVGGGGVGNSGKIHFYNITDYSDLSHVTLTYAFEGYDPVTVEFDIPGV
jgi:hypothetical protein